jgi:hypothetical protein
MSKVTFDGANKWIFVNTGITNIDVRVDMYLEWKKWVLESDNSKWLAAFRSFGGDPTTINQNAPSYFFLINNWRVIVDSLNVVFDNNLYSDDYDTPFVNINSSILSKNSDIPNINTISNTLTGITATLNDLSLDVKHILGLSQQNYRLSDHVYDSGNRLTSVIIKIFNSKIDCDNNINNFATYTMNAGYDANGLLVDYKVTKN